MRRILIAIRIFFVTLFSREVAGRVAEILAHPPLPAPVGGEEAPKPKPAKAPKPPGPGRSEALTLLATLQREARFVDFIKEPLAGYSDAQIGAAARDIHRDCGTVLERLFGIGPVVEEDEGAELEVPAGFDAGRYRLTGNVAGEPPFQGRLTHHGWEAAKCELPSWSGSNKAARIVAPVEVELK